MRIGRTLIAPLAVTCLLIRAATAAPGQIVAPSFHADDGFGSSVALNSTGTELLVGASPVPHGVSGTAATAYLYTLTSGQWQLTSTLSCNQGTYLAAVALSADGNTAMVTGGTGSCLYQAGGGWVAAPAVVATFASSISAPTAVALSSNGDTALVGIAAGDPGLGSVGVGHAGVAYLYQATGSTWAATPAPAATLYVNGNNELGFAVALSGDGSTALVTDPFTGSYPGCPSGGSGTGYIFQASGGVWAASPAVTATLISSSSLNDQCQRVGTSAALSADGNTVILGAPQMSNGGTAPSAFIFEASSGSWTASPSVTADIVSPSTTTTTFGQSVGLSGDGLTALVGDPTSNEASVVQAVNGTWPGIPVLGVSFTGNSCAFGSSVALSGDGLTGVAGAPSCSPSAAGSVYTTAVAAAVYAAPTVTTGTLTVAESSKGTGTLSAKPASISDTLTYAIASQPSHGTVTLDDASTGAYTYTPKTGYYGTDSFTFTAKDNQDGLTSSTGSVDVTVTASSNGGGGSSGGGSGGSGYGGGGGGAFSLLALAALFGAALRRRAG